MSPILKTWRSFVNTIRWHFAFINQQRGWLVVAVVFHFLWGIFNGQQILAVNLLLLDSHRPHIGDGVFLAFSGPSLGNDNMTVLLGWLLNKVFFLMLISALINGQLHEHDYIVMLMVRSRRIWWLGIVVTVILVAVGYVILVILATLGGVATQLRWDSRLSSFFVNQNVWQAASAMSLTQVIVSVFGLTVSSLAVIGLIQALVALHAHRTIWGTLTILTLALVAWIVGMGENAFVWQQWLPEVQSILSRHFPFEPRLPNFTLTMSLVYNFLFAVILLVIGSSLLRNFDFLGAHNDN
ncbi:MAG: hypothetical protein HKUEN02_22200 [Anaerolineaceae bacterium]|nr:MAG: hypothetical protein HKUEN02_22200 [Anaerolineaceae bacterium]